MKINYILIYLFIFSTTAYSQGIDNSFITKKEYGAMLYKNPRGIGCDKCHGNVGQGKLIAKYKQKDKKSNKLIEESLIAPAIKHLSLNDFKKILMKKRNKSLSMPTYFLTEEELTSIHFYITTIDK